MHPDSWTPAALKRANGWATLFWLANIPFFVASYFLMNYESFVKFSLLYLGVISIWACVASHFTTWRVESVEVDVEVESSTSKESSNHDT